MYQVNMKDDDGLSITFAVEEQPDIIKAIALYIDLFPKEMVITISRFIPYVLKK